MAHSGIRRLLAFVVACALVAVSTGCTQTGGSGPKVASPDKAGLFINVTGGKEDVHGVSMALHLASTALERGHRVVVFLNVASPIFGSTALGEDVRVADFAPVRTLVSEVVARGGKVLVCSHCAKVTGVDRSTLLPGVTVAEHGEILSDIEPGMVGLSY